MSKITVIRQGESLDFTFDRSGESIVSWICTINVKQFPGDTSLITRVIAPDSTANTWQGFLTQTETDALDPGLYMLIGILTNSSTDEEEQVPVRFNVTPSWAN